MKLYNTKQFEPFSIVLLSTMITVLSLALLIHQSTYAESNKSSSISTLDELVNTLVTGVKLENIITVPNEIHIGDIFEINATVVNTLPFNVTIIAGNCNSDFSTNFYNNIEEIITSQCMNRVLPTILEPGDETTVQTSSGKGTQYKAVAEGQVNGTAILLYSIELQPAGSSLKTLNSQIIKPFTFTILQ